MKIGDEVYVHGYVDEIRKDTIIIRNDGGYFGTVPSEVAKYVKPHIYGKQADAIIIDEPNSSEKPNNCEHITEDGVTCAKYPACDDCLDNPLNKVKGSERLLKGKDEPTISKMEQVDEPKICDTCRYYNSNIPCGSTPSACKEADKFAEEFVDGLKKLKPKDEPQSDCDTCKWGEWYRKGYDITMMSDECGGCCSWNNKWKPKDEPQTDENCNTCRHKDECEGATYEYKNTEWWCLGYAPIDEPQTDCAWGKDE